MGRRATGDAGGSADYAEEDAEVSRVQQLAEDGGGAEAEEPRSSPSPVIIWRHAAPVKIASNLPPDLLPPTDGKNASRMGMHAQRSSSVSSSSAAGPQPQLGSRAAASASVANELKERRAAFDRRMQYGAWYLPTEKWSTREQTASGEPRAGGKGGGRSGAGGSGGGEEGEEEDEEQNLTDTIPKLYSSRMYKDYLKSQRHTRMPHYLTRVEDSPKQLSSRRGNIPLIDSPTNDGPGDAASP